MDYSGRLDEVDWALLAELQQNARMSYAELGRRVGLTPPAVIERMRRMEDAEVIKGYRVELNLAKVDRPLCAVIRIAEHRVTGNLGKALKELPEVLECDRVTGEDCYIMKAAVASPEHLEAFLDRLSAYGRTTTCMVLSSPITNRVLGPVPAEVVPSQEEQVAAPR